MSGRGLANAGVFVLGLILVAGGAWGIFRGSQYIQIEQGWSSVISGSVAVTGGVLTLTVGFVLRRLDALLHALLTLGPDAVLATAAAPGPLRAERPAKHMPLGNELPASDERGPEAGFADPPLRAAAALNIDILADDRRSTPALHPPHGATAPSEPSRLVPPEAIHAAEPGPADDMARSAGVSDEPELDAAIEQLLAEERARGEPLREDTAQAAHAASVSDNGSDQLHKRTAEPEGTSEQAGGRGAGWRGLFSRKERSVATSVAPDNPQVEPALHPSPERNSVLADLETSTAASPFEGGDQTDPIPRTGDDWFDRALSGLDEVGAPRPTAGDIPNRIDSGHEITQSRLEISARPAEAESAGAPSSPHPAVIGRYTSGNTTYIMYADGSIEAETPTGILRFASLADLKVYVEGGQ